MTMVIKKPKAQKPGGSKSDTKYMDLDSVNPKYRDALLLLFSFVVMASALTLFVILIRQLVLDPKAKDKLHQKRPVRPEVKVRPRAGD